MDGNWGRFFWQVVGIIAALLAFGAAGGLLVGWLVWA